MLIEQNTPFSQCIFMRCHQEKACQNPKKCSEFGLKMPEEHLVRANIQIAAHKAGYAQGYADGLKAAQTVG